MLKSQQAGLVEWADEMFRMCDVDAILGVGKSSQWTVDDSEESQPVNPSSLLGYSSTRVTEEHHARSIPSSAMVDTFSTASSPPLQYPAQLLDWTPGCESPATEVMNTEEDPSSVLQFPGMPQLFGPAPAIQGSAPSLSLAQSSSREKKEDIVQQQQGSDNGQASGTDLIPRSHMLGCDGCECSAVLADSTYCDRHEIRQLRSRAIIRQCRRRVTGERDLLSAPQPIHNTNLISPLPHGVRRQQRRSPKYPK